MLLSLLLACAEAPVDAPLHLSGRVRTADGTPVAEARVRVWLGEGGREVEVPTALDGRWSAELGGDPAWERPGDRVRVGVSVDAEEYLTDVSSVWGWPGDDVSVYSVLSPARTIHLQCPGREDETCARGNRYVSVRCGPADGRLALVDADADGAAGLRIRCPDVPDLEVSVSGQTVRLGPGETVATFPLAGQR